MVFKFLKKKEEKVEKKSIGNCIVCNQPIYENDEYKTLYLQGQKYIVHKKCFRKVKKLARQFIKKGFKL